MRAAFIALLALMAACSLVNDPSGLMGGDADGGHADAGEIDAGVPSLCIDEDDCDNSNFICESDRCVQCPTGSGNCEPGGGCETDTLTSAAHCGGCGDPCISGVCSAGICQEGPLQFDRLAAGHRHVCARTTAGQVYCWGDNARGQSAPSSADDTVNVPRRVELDEGVQKIAAGGRHSCAMSEGAIYCWGDGRIGQGGDPTDGQIPRLVPYTDSPLDIAAGEEHTCVVRSVGFGNPDDVLCWGDNTLAQLGTTAGVVLPDGRDAVSVSAGAHHTCALADDDTLFCWGDGSFGQNGSAPPNVNGTPVPINLANVTAHAPGSTHTCAQLDSGMVWCWGANDAGQLSQPISMYNHTPQNVGMFERGSAVAAGGQFNCVAEDARVLCWGAGGQGRLGNSMEEGQTSPVMVAPLPITAHTIAAGNAFACALDLTMGIWCWGDNMDEQMGLGAVGEEFVATPIAIIFEE